MVIHLILAQSISLRLSVIYCIKIDRVWCKTLVDIMEFKATVLYCINLRSLPQNIPLQQTQEERDWPSRQEDNIV